MANLIKIFNVTENKPIPRSQILKAVNIALEGENIFESVVKIILVSDDNIHELNKRFLRHNRPTDVITFSLDENVIEGEIYISIDTAFRQAGEYKVSLKNELLRLAVHGALHLAGYNDKTAKERKAMGELEDKYINQI